MNEAYRAQVRLMLDLLPLVAEETAFRLKVERDLTATSEPACS